MSATPVAPSRVVELSRNAVDCLACGRIAVARIVGTSGTRAVENRTCLEHMGNVAEATPTDGFLPLTILWIFPVAPSVPSGEETP